MSSGQLPPNLTATTYAQTMAQLESPIVCTELYAPTQYAYNDPYMTPFPSSIPETQPWSHQARALSDVSNFNMQQQMTPQQHYPHQFQQPLRNAARPRSSPSTFGPGPDSIQWPTPNGLGIYSAAPHGQPTPVTSTFPPSVFTAYDTSDNYVAGPAYIKEEQEPLLQQPGSVSPPEIKAPQPTRSYSHIAPNPEGLTALKRKRDEDEKQEMSGSGKKRKRTASLVSEDLDDEQRLLLYLKEEKALAWKDIATEWEIEKGKPLSVPTLQMRYKRMRERYRVWEDEDVKALREAHDWYERCKWDIIATHMLECGINDRWNPKACQKKFNEMQQRAITMAGLPMSTAGLTPALSQLSSPIDAPQYMPFQ